MGTNKPDAGQGMVTTIQSIACGGTGGEMTAVDAKDGKTLSMDVSTRAKDQGLPDLALA